MGKIVSITEKVPTPSTLPDGVYTGIWGAWVIEVRYKDKIYELKVDEGVRGSGYRVIVIIKDGQGTFEELKN